MLLVSLYINCAERSCGAKIFTSTAAYAPCNINYRHQIAEVFVGRHHGDGL